MSAGSGRKSVKSVLCVGYYVLLQVQWHFREASTVM